MKNFIRTFESFTNESWYMPIGYEMEQEGHFREMERERDRMDDMENNDPSLNSSERPTIYSDVMQAIMSYDSTMLSDITSALEMCISGDMDPEKVDIPEQCRGLDLNDAKSLVSMIEKIREKKEEYQRDMEGVMNDLKEMSA